MGKPKIKIDHIEIDEIISLKLKTLGGIRKKLTYNSVWIFNKKIANNKQYIRENGKLFISYGYSIWASGYNAEDYYGRKRIDEIKRNPNTRVVGEEFSPGVQDIIMLVNDLSSKPEVLSRKLVLMFEKDINKIEILEKTVSSLTNKCKQVSKRMELFEKGFATAFYNSVSDNNSLPNVMCMMKSKDENIRKELTSMFDQDKVRLSQVISKEWESVSDIEAHNSVINMDLEKKKKRREIYEDDL